MFGLLVHVKKQQQKKGVFETLLVELGAKKPNVNRQESVICRWQRELPILELPPLFFRHVPHNLEGIYSRRGKGDITWSVGSSSTSPPVTKRARGKLAALAPIKGLARGAPGVWGRNCFSPLTNKRTRLVENMLHIPKRWHQAKGFLWCQGELSCNSEVTAILDPVLPTRDFHMPGC